MDEFMFECKYTPDDIIYELMEDLEHFMKDTEEELQFSCDELDDYVFEVTIKIRRAEDNEDFDSYI